MVTLESRCAVACVFRSSKSHQKNRQTVININLVLKSNCWMWSRFLIVGKGVVGKVGERVARIISIFDFAYVDILDYSEAYVDFSLRMQGQ